MGTILSWLYVFWILGIFLIFSSGVFEPVKTFWFFLGSLIFLVPVFYQKKSTLRFAVSDVLYLSWIIIALYSAKKGLEPKESIFGGDLRSQGVVFFASFWLLKMTIFKLENKFFSIFYKLFFLIILIECGLAIFQKISGYLVVGTIGNTNALLGFLAIGFFYILELGNTKNTLLSFLLITISFLSIGGTTSIILLMFLSIALVIQHFKFFTKTILILGTFGTAFFLFYSISNNQQISYFEDRIILWQVAVKKIFERPLFGYGFETIDVIYDKAYQENNLRLVGLAFDRSHNLILDLLLWTGVVGTLFFILWLLTEVKRIINSKSYSSLGGVFVWFSFAFFHPLGVVHWILLALLLGKFKFNKITTK